MRKLQIFLFVLLMLLSGCSRQERLDSSGVAVDWLAHTVPTEAPPTLPTAPAETTNPTETKEKADVIQPETAVLTTTPTQSETTALAAEPGQAERRTEPQAQAAEAGVEPVRTERDTGERKITGMQQMTLELSGGKSVSCWLYIPDEYSAAPGLIVYLHGGSGKGTDLRLITEAGGFPQYLQSGALGALTSYVLLPQLPKELKGWSEMDDTLMEMIRAVVQDYGIDETNISLTGHSMGGTGAWSIAAAHPGYFARVAPLSGSIRNTPANVQALLNTPVYAFVGEEDTIVDPESSIAFANALTEAGGDAAIVEIEGADHFSVPEKAYLGDYGLLSWLQGM